MAVLGVQAISVASSRNAGVSKPCRMGATEISIR